MIPYEFAIVDVAPNANSESIYYFENRAIILKQMQNIIAVEAPISKNLLFKKILKLWNTTRAGAKLNNYLTEIVDSIATISKNETHQEFYWNENLRPENLQNYRDNSIEKSSIEDIAQEEIKLAIMEIMEVNLSLSKDDLVRQTSKTFGFMKVGAQIDHIITLAIMKLVEDEKVKMVGFRVVIC